MERVGVCFPEGFCAAGISCGLKPHGKKDLSLIVSSADCTSAAVFTTNSVKSFSVLWSLKNIKNPARAVLINSGNANAAGGRKGWNITVRLMETLGKALKISPKNVLFASTGLIGSVLPEEKICASFKNLINAVSADGGRDSAEAIMTTDRKMKKTELVTGVARRGKGFVKIGAWQKAQA